MFKKWWAGFVLVLGIIIVATFAKASAEKGKKDELYKDMELFSDALTIIQAEYVEEPKPKDLVYGALKGMLDSLDPHSQFLDADTYNELKIDTEGRFGGIGVEIAVKDGLVTVVSPIEGTPAWKVGIKSGDRIVRIEKELTRDMTLSDVVKKMRGSPGTELNITVLRDKEDRMIDFKIIRDTIKVKDIKEAKIIADHIGYIRLVEFRENTGQNMNNVLEGLKKQGMSALILDLRNDPGGLLDEAIKVSEKFVPEGKLIVSTKGRIASQNTSYVSNGKNPILDVPMVVLVNEGSASASEIVAGALQDYHRAIILGTRTFGKGSVQSVIPLGDGTALRLTTSKYFTPLGRSIHGEGIEPDIVVEQEDAGAEPQDKTMRQKVEEVFREVERKENIPSEDKLKEYKDDIQLLRAIDLLKAIKIYKISGYPNAQIQKPKETK
ncbi:MAG: S41 family peptidase [Candidatus Omnitrophica bacterium]|nr:S41 family peptidase [Candidatus Omnitrophota bacterium]MDD5236502.1 S41 family peptidase [Candidatus Omnitrophota bacterium]MDD5610982.1 S41 family peptidase [Candidatus Omnitrophota bacterium]